MKKLTLNPETLAVESFAAADAPLAANGFFATRPQACDPFSLPPRCS